MAKRKGMRQTNVTLFQAAQPTKRSEKSRQRRLEKKVEGTVGDIEIWMVRAYEPKTRGMYLM